MRRREVLGDVYNVVMEIIQSPAAHGVAASPRCRLLWSRVRPAHHETYTEESARRMGQGQASSLVRGGRRRGRQALQCYAKKLLLCCRHLHMVGMARVKASS